MPGKKNVFARSCRELRSLRCLVMTSMFIAMNIALDLYKLRIDLPGMRIGVGFLTNASIGMLFGPVVCMLMGFCTDTLGFLLNPGSGGNAYFPGYTLTAMVAGVIWGLFLYRPDEKPASRKLSFSLRVLAARVLITLVCNVFMNTLWTSMLLGQGVWVTLIARLPAQLTYLPVQYLLLLLVLPFVQRLYRSLSLAPAADQPGSETSRAA